MGVHEQAERGFDRVAEEYERARPGYPAEAIGWLGAELGLGPDATVVDVGAGTGKLTRLLVPFGAEVIAIEPVAGMRAVLSREARGVQPMSGTAESLPLGDGAADAIVVAQAFHWFDAPRALTEFRRVLRPQGRVALIWNRRERSDPLQQAVDAIVTPHRGGAPQHADRDWREIVVDTGLFRLAGELYVPFRQEFEAEQLVDRVASTSYIGALPDDERAQVLDQVRELAAERPKPLSLAHTTEVWVFERD